MIRVALAFVLSALAAPALADPCAFVPDRGATPDAVRDGRTFAGPVVHVGDGDSLCVDIGPGRGGAFWVEVRLADFRAPELSEPGGRAAREALVAIAMNRRVRCVAANRTYDRVAARCTLDGVALGDLMRRRGVSEGGR